MEKAAIQGREGRSSNPSKMPNKRAAGMRRILDEQRKDKPAERTEWSPTTQDAVSRQNFLRGKEHQDST